MGEVTANAITVVCHQHTTVTRPQTFALQDELPLFIPLVILLKGSLSFSLLSPITRDPFSYPHTTMGQAVRMGVKRIYPTKQSRG